MLAEKAGNCCCLFCTYLMQIQLGETYLENVVPST